MPNHTAAGLPLRINGCWGNPLFTGACGPGIPPLNPGIVYGPRLGPAGNPHIPDFAAIDRIIEKIYKPKVKPRLKLLLPK